ncbi:hypothetical protein QVN97_12195 [Bacteroides caecigallinarum]|nr:hypothetical protein [Bacteroides caecigallinarum]
MEYTSINQIIEKISSTLNFFDFTFIVSGFTSLSITYYTLSYYIDTGTLELNFKNIVFAIFFTYIFGILSFAGGKKIRLFNIKGRFNTVFKQAIICENKISGVGGKKIKINEYDSDTLEQLYTRMWIDLRSNKDGIETVIYLNRSVMMQSICEGLFFSSILLLISSILLCFKTDNGYFCIVTIASVACGYLFKKEAQRSAEIQIKELVSAYYKFILN